MLSNRTYMHAHPSAAKDRGRVRHSSSRSSPARSSSTANARASQCIQRPRAATPTQDGEATGAEGGRGPRRSSRRKAGKGSGRSKEVSDESDGVSLKAPTGQSTREGSPLPAPVAIPAEARSIKRTNSRKSQRRSRQSQHAAAMALESSANDTDDEHPLAALSLLSVSAPPARSEVEWEMPSVGKRVDNLNWQQSIVNTDVTPARRTAGNRTRTAPSSAIHSRQPSLAVPSSSSATSSVKPLNWQQELLQSASGRPHSYSTTSALDWPLDAPAKAKVDGASPKKSKARSRPAAAVSTPVSAPPASGQFEPFELDDIFGEVEGGPPRKGTKSAPPFNPGLAGSGRRKSPAVVSAAYASAAFHHAPSPSALPSISRPSAARRE